MAAWYTISSLASASVPRQPAPPALPPSSPSPASSCRCRCRSRDSLQAEHGAMGSGGRGEGTGEQTSTQKHGPCTQHASYAVPACNPHAAARTASPAEPGSLVYSGQALVLQVHLIYHAAEALLLRWVRGSGRARLAAEAGCRALQRFAFAARALVPPRRSTPSSQPAPASWAHVEGWDAVRRHAHHLVQQLKRLFSKHAATLLLPPPPTCMRRWGRARQGVGRATVAAA